MPSDQKKKSVPSRNELLHVVHELKQSVEVIRRETVLMNDFKWGMANAFLRGVAYALGALMAVAIIVPVFLWFLRGIEWPPLIGGVISNIIEYIDQAR